MLSTGEGNGKLLQYSCLENPRNSMNSMVEGESGINEESSINTYTLACIKQIADGRFLYNTGNPALCSVMTYRGRMRGGEWRGGSLKRPCIIMADLFLCGRNQHNVVKQFPPTKNNFLKSLVKSLNY